MQGQLALHPLLVVLTTELEQPTSTRDSLTAERVLPLGGDGFGLEFLSPSTALAPARPRSHLQ